jgi:hypothetical protein
MKEPVFKSKRPKPRVLLLFLVALAVLLIGSYYSISSPPREATLIDTSSSLSPLILDTTTVFRPTNFQDPLLPLAPLSSQTPVLLDAFPRIFCMVPTQIKVEPDLSSLVVFFVII